MESLGIVYLIGIVFLFILAVLWFFLPFAIFGTKEKLQEIIVEAKRSNELLQQLVSALVKK